MDRGKRIIGVILIAVSIAALITWEKWGKAQLLYDEVLVCTENVTRGTILRKDMLKTVRMEVGARDYLRPSDMEKLIGKEAASFIHKEMPLFPQYFDRAELSARGKEGKYVLSIPEDWLDSMPTSIGRGDRAYFFYGKKYLTSAPVSASDKETRSIEVVVDGKQAAELSGITSGGGKLVIVYG